jgi:4-aminobutyrate aminotransferase
VRGLGLLLGVELLRDRATLERATDEAESVMYAALARGLNFKITMGNILTLTPALIITRAEMDQALAILEACIAEQPPLRSPSPPPGSPVRHPTKPVTPL